MMTANSALTLASTHNGNHASPSSEALLALCKASGDTLRLDILRVLSQDSFAVTELCQILDYKQSGLSHHLKILAKAGLVTTRREGNSIFYRRANLALEPGLNNLQQTLLATVDQLPMSAAVSKRLQAIQTERGERSREFFDQYADRFSQQQEQIAAYELYGKPAADLVASSTNNKQTVLEVGPGEGAFLVELSAQFATVYGLDNATQMLDKAERTVSEQQLGNVKLIYGDTKASALQSLNIDCIVVNMVLHHTPSPAEIFSDLAGLLDRGGQLFVTDLCRHDQAWVQSACGDLWLGFEPEDLNSWASNAGLSEGQSVYLTQRNGFRVQIRQFIKL